MTPSHTRSPARSPSACSSASEDLMRTHLRFRCATVPVVSLLLLAGCENVLEVKPETFSGTNTYYQTPEQMDRAVAGTYAALQTLYGTGANAAAGPMWLLAEMRADNTTYEQNQTDRSQV